MQNQYGRYLNKSASQTGDHQIVRWLGCPDSPLKDTGSATFIKMMTQRSYLCCMSAIPGVMLETNSNCTLITQGADTNES